ncbi:MAG: hypothetical protein ACYCW6_09900 [Candidatus Xenobia bacterium]
MLLLLLASARPAHAADVNYLEPTINGISANVVVVNLKSHHFAIRPVVAPHCGDTLTRSFMSMVHAVHAVAAINGTFFDGGSLRTIGSLVLDGKMIYEGYIGNAIGIDRDGVARFLKVNHENGRHVNWSRSPPARRWCTGANWLSTRGRRDSTIRTSMPGRVAPPLR